MNDSNGQPQLGTRNSLGAWFIDRFVPKGKATHSLGSAGTSFKHFRAGIWSALASSTRLELFEHWISSWLQ